MIQPHPNENDRLEETPSLPGKKTVLLYLVAHCPLPFQDRENRLWGSVLEKDVEDRVDWARTVLHTLFPVNQKKEEAAS